MYIYYKKVFSSSSSRYINATIIDNASKSSVYCLYLAVCAAGVEAGGPSIHNYTWRFTIITRGSRTIPAR